MNAVEIIEQIRACNAEVVIEENALVVRGKGERLRPDLATALREEKAAVMVALGAPLDAAIATILEELRPYLPPALRHLPDGKLLALVNWSMLHAWNAAAGRIHAAPATQEARTFPHTPRADEQADMEFGDDHD